MKSFSVFLFEKIHSQYIETLLILDGLAARTSRTL